MPLKKQKPREEKIVENFFRVDESNVERATEKKVKNTIVEEKKITERKIPEMPLSKEQISKATIEKKFSRPDRESLETIESTPIKPKRKYKKRKGTRKKAKKKAKTTTSKIVKYNPQKIGLKNTGYELIITEKPQAALKIATALGDTITQENNKIPYYEVDRNGQKIIVACAVGHLFTLKQIIAGSSIPIFEVKWIPNYLARKGDFTKKYHDTILKLTKNAGSLTVATDFDIEGEVIGMNIVRYICNQKDAKRMKFSTLTKDELNNAYENKLPTIEWGQAIAGETRHYLDWFYGINLSRALMNAIKTTGKFRIMSIGRVQGPALKLIVDKEKEISKFKSEPFWQIFITINNKKNKLELKHNQDIFDKKELEKFKNLNGKTTIAETKKREQILPPPTPFNLTDLQREAYKLHGITPSKTLRSAQALYLSGLISYPRTSSQKLPKEIGYKTILKKISKRYKVENLIKKNTPTEGKKEDPAHPSIYPTGNEQILSGNEEKIYNLIARRFLSLFCEDAIIDNKTVKTKMNELIFSARGAVIREKNWLKIYPAKIKEEKIPDMEGEVKITNSRIEEKETQPPKRFSPASILTQLEKRNLGTKATRASILETLYDRGYIQGESIKATSLGISLIDTLEKYSPIIIDAELTRKFEGEMEKIRETKNKKNLIEKEQETLNQAKEKITQIAKDFEKNEKDIGKELLEANVKQREQQKIENKIIQCPKCKKGDLAINYSKKWKRSFIACDSYPNCKNTLSLPPNRTIKKTKQICKECQYPLLMALQPKKKPWIFCFNPKCPTNQAWEKKKEEYKKDMENSAN
ncbi:DNA topoisomerase I [archaeon]|jgi:DNA topoisomerase I|nr:DNA topoisomerase I [archaeon]MBT4373648.1 DNA topoisomerase I [archaeon]MBT4531702.1 DNA topoisomerase I [archaeon]MBT7001814.1 DNA topoisomerase I [archaeon]MBT7281799.1 DNA topoisomerase I [archaeon]